MVAPFTEYASNASFFRTALLLGLLPGARVVKWAETVLADDNNAPHHFSEIVSIPPGDVTLLRYTLLELCTEQVTEPVMRAIFGLIYRDLASGKRNINDTVTVLSQFRRFVKLGREAAEQLLQFEMVWSSGKTGDAAEQLRLQVSGWLERFRGAEEKLEY
jgi:hypothetical protein